MNRPRMTRRAQIILLAASLFLVAPVSAQKPAPPIVVLGVPDSADGSTPDAYRTNIQAASRNAATLTLAVIAYLTK